MQVCGQAPPWLPHPSTVSPPSLGGPAAPCSAPQPANKPLWSLLCFAQPHPYLCTPASVDLEALKLPELSFQELPSLGSPAPDPVAPPQPLSSWLGPPPHAGAPKSPTTGQTTGRHLICSHRGCLAPWGPQARLESHPPWLGCLGSPRPLPVPPSWRGWEKCPWAWQHLVFNTFLQFPHQHSHVWPLASHPQDPP